MPTCPRGQVECWHVFHKCNRYQVVSLVSPACCKASLISDGAQTYTPFSSNTYRSGLMASIKSPFLCFQQQTNRASKGQSNLFGVPVGHPDHQELRDVLRVLQQEQKLRLHPRSTFPHTLPMFSGLRKPTVLIHGALLRAAARVSLSIREKTQIELFLELALRCRVPAIAEKD